VAAVAVVEAAVTMATVIVATMAVAAVGQISSKLTTKIVLQQDNYSNYIFYFVNISIYDDLLSSNFSLVRVIETLLSIFSFLNLLLLNSPDYLSSNAGYLSQVRKILRVYINTSG
jgi:hypothetical protein